MRISISNIAWDVDEDEGVVGLLRTHGVTAIDVAPGKYFPDPARASAAEVDRVERWWRERGIEICGMQSLLFGAPDLNLFGTRAVQLRMLDYLGAVCRIGAGLGGTRLVFGSPKNKDRLHLPDEDAAAIAVDFFGELGERARKAGVVICLEPTPQRYGANFMMTSEATASVVTRLNHPAIKMQIDAGAMAINGEDPGATIARYARIVGHVHASEPDLVPIGQGSADHRRTAAALRRHLPNHMVTIEMRAPDKATRMTTLAGVLKLTEEHYGDAKRAS